MIERHLRKNWNVFQALKNAREKVEFQTAVPTNDQEL